MYIHTTDIMRISRNPVKTDHMKKKHKTIRKKTASSTSSIAHTMG